MIQTRRKVTPAVRQGFTLVELMLAMVFVSMLLLAIAMTIIQAGNIYSKGMALKDINQSARMLIDDMKRTVSAAGAVQLDAGSYMVRPATGVPVSGRLCLGNYSYLWNTVDATLENTHALRLPGGNPTLISMVKVVDVNKVYCATQTNGAPVIANTVRAADVEKVSSLLVEGDHTLSMTGFTVNIGSTAVDPTTGQRLLSVAFGIGTGEPSAMKADRSGCLAPGVANANPTYCNVQQFDLVIRTEGGV